MTITKAILPEKSILKTDEEGYDYIDSFHGEFVDSNKQVGPTEIAKAFFVSGPEWGNKLFALRNAVVGLTGLKTAGKHRERKKQLDNFNCEPGEQIGLFKVFSKTVNEVILGEDDRHLNFRVSLFVEQQITDNTKKKLTISTVVKYNNWFGRLYFLPVRPFHKLIVPAMLRRIIKNIEN